jgi:hypothetical protein
MRLQLLARSKRGKQLAQEFGTVWQIVRFEEDVRFSSRAGPWLFVEPLVEDSSKRLLGGRWIHSQYDEHFSIKKEV